GAARLAARAAGRMGAGLVTLAAPHAAWPVYASALTSVIVRPIGGIEDFKALLDDTRRNVVLLGPGGGTTLALRETVLAALGTRRSVVPDAARSTGFADDPSTLTSAVAGPPVPTPHEGEFSRLFPVEGDKLTRARAAAAASRSVIVLKGPDTVVAAPDGQAVVNGNAPPE